MSVVGTQFETRNFVCDSRFVIRSSRGHGLMGDRSARQRIETEAIILGYAMSRLDARYLAETSAKSWRQAFEIAAAALSIPAGSFKNLRDEFDPLHGNRRKGWRGRAMRPNRQRVADEFRDVSDDALIEFVRRLLIRDTRETNEAVEAVMEVTRIPANVAERLLTGRRAEEFFVRNASEIIGIEADALTDCRIAAKGYDFAAPNADGRVFEIKGIKQSSGGILFTDREWSEAADRKDAYWLIVIGNLSSRPSAKVYRDPHASLPTIKCVWRRSLTASWMSTVSLA